ncbi:hypothetical protein Hanom_Chr06g00479221 [Helianthus anomalus]
MVNLCFRSHYTRQNRSKRRKVANPAARHGTRGHNRTTKTKRNT